MDGTAVRQGRHLAADFGVNRPRHATPEPLYANEAGSFFSSFLKAGLISIIGPGHNINGEMNCGNETFVGSHSRTYSKIETKQQNPKKKKKKKKGKKSLFVSGPIVLLLGR